MNEAQYSCLPQVVCTTFQHLESHIDKISSRNMLSRLHTQQSTARLRVALQACRCSHPFGVQQCEILMRQMIACLMIDKRTSTHPGTAKSVSENLMHNIPGGCRLILTSWCSIHQSVQFEQQILLEVPSVELAINPKSSNYFAVWQLYCGLKGIRYEVNPAHCSLYCLQKWRTRRA